MNVLIDTALLEFERQGKATTARCDKCGSIIEVKGLGKTTWEIKCSCGRFAGVFRGL
jgi:hypothetical protein